MAKTKEPKAAKAPKGDKPKKTKGPKVKGRLLDRATNVAAVLFGLSLVAQKVVSG